VQLRRHGGALKSEIIGGKQIGKTKTGGKEGKLTDWIHPDLFSNE